jgi:hypothetical protein
MIIKVVPSDPFLKFSISCGERSNGASTHVAPENIGILGLLSTVVEEQKILMLLSPV